MQFLYTNPERKAFIDKLVTQGNKLAPHRSWNLYGSQENTLMSGSMRKLAADRRKHMVLAAFIDTYNRSNLYTVVLSPSEPLAGIREGLAAGWTLAVAEGDDAIYRLQAVVYILHETVQPTSLSLDSASVIRVVPMNALAAWDGTLVDHTPTPITRRSGEYAAVQPQQ